MARSLTPAELSFQSFRHSQGGIHAQMAIFGYITNLYGIEPDLHPSPEEEERYLAYIYQPTSAKHMVYATEFLAREAIRSSFESLREAVAWPVYDYSKYSKSAISLTVALALLKTESKLLEDVDRFSGKSTATRDYSARLPHRIATGKSSLLYYYGRNGASTGFEEFDSMYADAWGHVQTHQGIQEQYREHHETSVHNAEMAVLGHLVLAPDLKA